MDRTRRHGRRPLVCVLAEDGWLKDDSTEPGTPHEWEITTVFCRPNPAHNPSHWTVENVWCWLKKYPAPVRRTRERRWPTEQR